MKFLEEKGILFVGTGVSGGEEGALKGPSLMPGGHIEVEPFLMRAIISIKAWPHIKPIFQAICAKVEVNIQNAHFAFLVTKTT
jgi:6-phosphogluconate dehydrogenase